MSLKNSIEKLKAAMRQQLDSPKKEECPPNLTCYKTINSINGKTCQRNIITYDPNRGCIEEVMIEKVMNGECPDVYRACP